MKILIAEDSKEFAEVIIKTLDKHYPEIEILGPFHQESTILDCLEKDKPEALLLDIELGHGTSFDILKKYKQKHKRFDFEIIFITGHPTYDYSTKALNYSALYFLTKPLDQERFREGMDRLISIINNKALANKLENDPRIESLLEIVENIENKVNKLTIHLAKGGLQIVSISDITHLIADGVICEIHLKNGCSIKAFKNLGFYKNLLEADHNFFSISHSISLNLDYLQNYNHSTKEVCLSNNVKINASRRGGQLLKSKLDNAQLFVPKQSIAKKFSQFLNLI